jgi:hypothetical protein
MDVEKKLRRVRKAQVLASLDNRTAIVFAAACGTVLWGCYRLLDTPARRARLEHGAALGPGAIASFRVIDRVVGFWG